MRSGAMFYVAVAVGIVLCLFWIAQLVFVKLHLKWTERIIESSPEDEKTGVTVIHPIKDLDFELEENFDSWFNQNYKGPIQHIFSFQEPDDPAIPVIRYLLRKYPQADTQIIVNPVIPGLNGKSSNMVHALKLAKYDIALFIDSDIRVKPDFIVKMVRPLKNRKNAITTCGQINMGGTDFWTRFFTFLQNNETIFIWAFLTKLGFDVGATGAAFAMRRETIEEVGGLEAFGGSLLEDLHLGNTLYKMGYRLVLGPFLECYVDRLGMEKSLNYAKRVAIGIKTHILVELPAFVIMLSWYWILLILGVIFQDLATIFLSFFYMGVRVIHGLMMRLVTRNRILPVDLFMALFFDLFGTFYLIYSLNNPFVTWRGIKYELRKGGYINGVEEEEKYSI
jgi:ceramide glucosyltransferase